MIRTVQYTAEFLKNIDVLILGKQTKIFSEKGGEESLISNSVADLAGTVFSLLLFYQDTMGARTLVSPEE